jgi:hypothetical protein
MTEVYSHCCGAPLRVACEKTLVGYTNWFVCTLCAGPCDAVPVEIEQEPPSGKDLSND